MASAGATFVNPYGWRLHVHIYRYLTDRYLMDRIDEFQSPNFHDWSERCFAIILLLVLIALVGGRLRDHQYRFRLSHFGVLLLATYAGFYSSRNLPVSSMLLVLIAGPLLWRGFTDLAQRPAAWPWLRERAAGIAAFSDRMGTQEAQLRGHLWPIVSVVCALAICLQGGRLGPHQLIQAHFDPEKVPVAAVNFLQHESQSSSDQQPVFTKDSWGGYLIYAMYPDRQVLVDDRHDLYGPDRIREYLTVTQAEAGWQNVITKWQIRTALLPADSTLANLLRELPREWRVAYEDKVAVVFERQ